MPQRSHAWPSGFRFPRVFGGMAHIGTVVLCAHVALLAWGAAVHSPTYDEVGHLPAGLSHWELGRFELYRVNPPLVRIVAAVPVVLSGAKTDWHGYDAADTARSDFEVGRDFLAANGRGGLWYFTLARWACIPFSVLGALVCWAWAHQLYGQASGIIALVLWCLCPNILAHGELLTPDVGASSLGIAASYAFWRWLRAHNARHTAIAGGLLGLVELTKTTWLILFLLWPMLWIFWKAFHRKDVPRSSWLGQAAQLTLILAVALWVINLGYLGEGSFESLKTYQFISRSLNGGSNEVAGQTTGNRFADSWLGSLLVPIPKNYILGIDHQKSNFERGRPAYLRGEWKSPGWYHYYVYAMLIKVPLGTWALWLLALAMSLVPGRWLVADPDGGNRPRIDDHSLRVPGPDVRFTGIAGRSAYDHRGRWRDEIILLAPAIAILAFVSLETGINRHLRYVLPAFPFLFVWASKVACYANFDWTQKRKTSQKVLAGLILVALTWSAASSLFIYPHSLSYFNELVGGPRGGHWHLAVSNVDWGQDIFYLERWYRQHPQARPLHCGLGPSLVDPRTIGIEPLSIPQGPVMNRPGAPATRDWPWSVSQQPNRSPSRVHSRPSNPASLGPQPGWFAVSDTYAHEPHGRYEYFLHFEPVASAGYSTMLYFITRDEANQLRKKLGMELLPPIAKSGAN